MNVNVVLVLVAGSGGVSAVVTVVAAAADTVAAGDCCAFLVCWLGGVVWIGWFVGFPFQLSPSIGAAFAHRESVIAFLDRIPNTPVPPPLFASFPFFSHAQSIYRHGIRQLHGMKTGPWAADEVATLQLLVRDEKQIR